MIRTLPVPGVESVTQCEARTEALTHKHEKKCQMPVEVEGYHNKSSFFWTVQEVIGTLPIPGVESVAQ